MQTKKSRNVRRKKSNTVSTSYGRSKKYLFWRKRKKNQPGAQKMVLGSCVSGIKKKLEQHACKTLI